MQTPELPPFDHQPQPYTGPSPDEILRLRKEFLNPGIFLYYKKPLTLVEGKMQYVWDETGRRYLDAFGGIVTISVGHCHPEVVAAARKQNELLQHSTTIYLHPNIAEYAEKLASKMPGELKVCYFVNSGSEANDLALLMARAYTGNYDMIALRNAYHGGNASGHGPDGASHLEIQCAAQLRRASLDHARSLPRHLGPRRSGGREEIRGRCEKPDRLRDAGSDRGLHRGVDPGRRAAASFFPTAICKHAYEHVRAAGGVCIADEVQTGFGRTGTHYWGFETQGVIPDIVCMAKGIGNGCPLGAVVTTPKIAAALSQRIHFNTFGGNPVVCAQGKAVLEVIDRERLAGQRARDGQPPFRRAAKTKGETQRDRRRPREGFACSGSNW